MTNPKCPTKLSKKLLDTLSPWVRTVLLETINLKIGDYIYNSYTDYLVPLDKMPKVRLWKGVDGTISFIIWVKDDGTLDFFMEEDGKLYHYINCVPLTMNSDKVITNCKQIDFNFTFEICNEC